eukprot:m.201091 g.201091  ORF g.201091 m.201091 type:complete len:55 (-) comp32789_c0_seq3:195-359(-)
MDRQIARMLVASHAVMTLTAADRASPEPAAPFVDLDLLRLDLLEDIILFVSYIR